MKKRLFLLAICVVFVSVALFVYVRAPRSSASVCKTHFDTYSLTHKRIGTKTYTLLVADTPRKWEYGLMNITKRSDICNADGMVFTFPVSIQQTFWNKDTLVDLTVYWMQDDTVVSTQSLQAITKGMQTVQSPKPVNQVVELLVTE